MKKTAPLIALFNYTDSATGELAVGTLTAIEMVSLVHFVAARHFEHVETLPVTLRPEYFETRIRDNAQGVVFGYGSEKLTLIIPEEAVGFAALPEHARDPHHVTVDQLKSELL